MSRATFGRDICKPTGYAHSSTAQGANIMVSRVMLLMWLAIHRGIIVMLEQPVSSLMQHHHRFQDLIRANRLWVSKHTLGLFYGESAKPIMLFCNWPFVNGVNDYQARAWCPVSSGVYTAHVDDLGRKRTTGASGLKATQAYPREFGRAVARVYDEHRAEVLAAIPAVSLMPLDMDMLYGSCDDTWGDANLDGVLGLLFALVERGVGFL